MGFCETMYELDDVRGNDTNLSKIWILAFLIYYRYVYNL